MLAPHFDRLSSARPSAEDLYLRARRLRLSLDSATLKNLPVMGVGHSIGASILLALAGAEIWMDPESQNKPSIAGLGGE